MDDRLHIVADCDIPFLEGVLEPHARVTYKKGSSITPLDIHDADTLLIRTRTQCNAALLDGSRINLIATATIGHDHIDSQYCEQHGIQVATAAGCNARGVLQYIMGTLAALSDIDGWVPSQTTLGVIGIGNVGGLVAEYGRRLGFRVLCCDPPKKRLEPSLDYLPLNELLPQCDIVTVHVPLVEAGIDKSSEMADSAFFSVMKKGAAFINSSRGKVMSDRALTEALQNGHLGHAVIDTWNEEPDINLELLRLCTFATPHIAGYSLQGKAAGTATVVHAVGTCYDLPLDDWYPPQVERCIPNPDITWNELKQSIPSYFDIHRETEILKTRPDLFESLRNHYNYRREYF